jgi:hypothetical protein
MKQKCGQTVQTAHYSAFAVEAASATLTSRLCCTVLTRLSAPCSTTLQCTCVHPIRCCDSTKQSTTKNKL